FGAGKPSGNYGRRSDADKPFGAGKPSGNYGRRSETDKPFGTGKPSGGPKQGRPVRVFRKDRYD
ncbi:MAG: hypothetical protein LBJ86_06920, partial [Spirochaetaceae bacterium]|nr:hypothetical protein [Spirochaetaceae bacterium]